MQCGSSRNEEKASNWNVSDQICAQYYHWENWILVEERE